MSILALGKTTTINMLTGLLKPTSGDANVMGASIVNQMSIVRQNIGICLQHDCLFDLLNVQEHIEFFGMVGSFNLIAFVGLLRTVSLKAALTTFITIGWAIPFTISLSVACHCSLRAVTVKKMWRRL